MRGNHNNLGMDYLKDEWYSADSFQWTHRQVKWLLSWLPFLRATGYDWPPAPNKREYEVAPIHTKKPYQAVWENEHSILAHLENRLCKLGLDGVLVKGIFSHREDAEWYGKCLNIPSRVIVKRACNALDKLVTREQESIKGYYSQL
jgi:hypothetical protein